MNRQSTEALDDESTPLARMKIFAAETNDYTIRAAQIRPEIQELLASIAPQTSEEAVEAVARALATAEGDSGDWRCFVPHARAAIAAMPSIPQESDAEVTEEMLEAGYRAAKEDGLTGPRKSCEALVKLIYTAMTSARDRRG